MQNIYAYSSASGEFTPIIEANAKKPKSETYNTDSIIALNQYKALDYPTDPVSLAEYINISSLHRRALSLKVNAIVGNGYNFYNTKDNIDIIREFSGNPNNNFGDTLDSLLNTLIYNLEFSGNGFIECIKAGNAIAWYPTNTLYTYVVPNKKNTDVEMYVKVDNDYNVKKEFSALRFDENIINGRRYMFHLKNDCISSDYYGEPEYVSAINSISGNYIIDQWKINFFNNNARFDYAIIINGGELDKSAKDKIKAHLEENHSTYERSHKALVLGLPEGVTIDIKQLNQTTGDEFLKTKDYLKLQILSAHGIVPDILGVANGGKSIGGNDALGALKLFNETYVKPKQRIIEIAINKLFVKFFDINPEFKLNQMNITDKKTEALIRQMDITSGILSRSYAQRKHYPEQTPEDVLEINTEYMVRIEGNRSKEADESNKPEDNHNSMENLDAEESDLTTGE